MFTLFATLLLLIQLILAIFVLYLIILMIAAYFAPKVSKQTQPISQKFIILIPAHNESQLLPHLLSNLAKLDYPKELYTVHVIADNCEDSTAQIAKEYGVTVHERFDPHNRGKGHALNWALQKIGQEQIEFDAVAIIDADSAVSSNFLKVMNEHLLNGHKAIQAYYAVSNADTSWAIRIRNIALILLHYLRPQGRMVLGGSAGLKGNGMVFSAEIMKTYAWSTSLTEDIEFHMALLLDGHRVVFAPDAVVKAEMPDNLKASKSQTARWEQGRLETARIFVPRLAKKMVSSSRVNKSFVYFDAIMEHLIPPFAILLSLSLFSWVLKLSLNLAAGKHALNNLWTILFDPLSMFLIGGQIIYILGGLKLVNAPFSTYRTLLFAPVYIVWKIWQIIVLLFGRKKHDWIRTARNQS